MKKPYPEFSLEHYRYLTFEEANSLKYGNRVAFISRFNDVRLATVQGKPKTWKTRPGNITISLKYGLYEFFKAEMIGGAWRVNMELVKEV